MEWTALLYSARHGHSEVAKILVDKGANVEAKNNVILRRPSALSSTTTIYYTDHHTFI
jgi:ankyrin repeat protein